MDEEQQLSFYTEWHNTNSDEVKQFLLNYFGDNTLELLDRYTKKTFLKRIFIPTIKLSDIYIGSSITIYARRHKIIGSANEFTKKMLESQLTQTIFVVSCCEKTVLGPVITLLEQSSLQIRGIRMVQLTTDHIGRINQSLAHMPQKLVPGNFPSLVIQTQSTQNEILSEVTRSLQNKGFTSYVQILSSLHDISFLLQSPATATYKNCSVCIVKPRILLEKQLGKLIHMIIDEGFEITAMKTMHFTMEFADEFFGIYKGIFSQYHENLKYLCSGPCLAMEISGPELDTVISFREFCGPFDVGIAKVLQPESIRAKFGRSNLLNALHCTDCPEDGVMESQFIFRTLD